MFRSKEEQELEDIAAHKLEEWEMSGAIEGFPALKTELGKRRAAEAHLKACLEQAQKCDAKHARMVVTDKSTREFPEEGDVGVIVARRDQRVLNPRLVRSGATLGQWSSGIHTVRWHAVGTSVITFLPAKAAERLRLDDELGLLVLRPIPATRGWLNLETLLQRAGAAWPKELAAAIKKHAPEDLVEELWGEERDEEERDIALGEVGT
jgi:hypothetical protein